MRVFKISLTTRHLKSCTFSQIIKFSRRKKKKSTKRKQKKKKKIKEKKIKKKERKKISSFFTTESRNFLFASKKISNMPLTSISVFRV